MPHTTIEQWQVLQAIVEEGGFAQAATALHRSQSSVSYAVAQLQERLGVALLRVEGRRAQLTETGSLLLRDARPLIADLERLEARAQALVAGDEPLIRLRMDAAFPRPRLFAVLAAFRAEHPHTRVELVETARLKVKDAFSGTSPADLCIASHAPGAHLSEPVADITFIAVAAAGHPLCDPPRGRVTLRDLARHLVVTINDLDAPPIDNQVAQRAGQRWSVNTVEAALSAIGSGLGFGWLPRALIADELAAGRLRPLPLAAGGTRTVPLHLIYADYERAGPAVRALGHLLAQPAGRTGDDPLRPPPD